MNYRTAETRARQQKKSRTRIVEAPITHRCGHEVLYRSTEYGWAIVAGMSADVDCDTCNQEQLNWCAGDGGKLADEYPMRRAEFDAAVARRDARMVAEGIPDVFDSRIADEQIAVLRARTRLTESEHAKYLLSQCPGLNG